MFTWESLENACAQCRACALCQTRTNLVFGVGEKSAEILLVGEGPGEKEDLDGVPFVGKAGQLLDDMLKIIGLDRKTNVYIANVVKCRPPGNRDPLHQEQAACLPWLREQFRLIRPKIVLCLGRIAAGALIHPDFRITSEHGQWFEKSGVFFMALYHPAALLRDDSKRPETFVDLKNVEEKILQICSHTVLNKY
ncbi:MAG: uracil-DNA glycosylase [Oscillospiraceae bacterium]|nr:uracil-DNA glycosylase [Oscillospiraceae bacterium]